MLCTERHRLAIYTRSVLNRNHAQADPGGPSARRPLRTFTLFSGASSPQPLHHAYITRNASESLRLPCSAPPPAAASSHIAVHRTLGVRAVSGVGRRAMQVYAWCGRSGCVRGRHGCRVCTRRVRVSSSYECVQDAMRVLTHPAPMERGGGAALDGLRTGGCTASLLLSNILFRLCSASNATAGTSRGLRKCASALHAPARTGFEHPRLACFTPFPGLPRCNKNLVPRLRSAVFVHVLLERG
ncbi:hypothetical protein HYPSUDRAFT_893746 [Hypholoma sublateritium FD-334 SS-4]|uniref:Uncharacterized protein n=1 Tax=Hypholoma sublateritium (strain FD-334 SS-4) TaxID=945553 RepID=A0A0D2KXY1_HYPSF|nr:hypothetical protein HYPSUDRAFT_893746 [Hypholoma sublateritium FD-334 SS-4]